MQPGAPIIEHRFASGPCRGTRLSLYPGRLLHDGGTVVEHMPLAHLASVRVELAREGGMLKWALILVKVAALLALSASPVRALAARAAHDVAEQATRDGGSGTGSALQQVFQAVEEGSGTMRLLAWVCMLGAAVFAVAFLRGRTLLTVAFAATEREHAVRSRDRALIEFAEALSAHLAEGLG